VPAAAGAARPPAPPAPRPAAPLRAPSAQATLPPRTPAGTARSRAAAGGPSGEPAGGRSAAKTTLAVLGGIVAVAVIALLLITQVFGGGGHEAPPKPNSVGAAPTAGRSPGGSTSKKTSSKGSKVNRADITVAVLNGTTITGLARGASDRLQQAGFKGGAVTNDTTNQARAATAVFYTPGNRAAAVDVAKVIGVGTDAVQPIDQTTKVLAGNDAQVVVSVGTDKAQ
jgi:hypothetical protein